MAASRGLHVGQLADGSLPRLSDVVPQADDRLVPVLVLEAEHAHAGGAAEEEPPGARRQSEPAGRDHADDVAAGERQHVALDAAHAGDEAVGPGGDVLRRFAVRAAVAEQLPAGPLLQDVPGQLPLEAAVVPLDQVRIDLRDRPEAGQLARLRGTLQRAGEDARRRRTAAAARRAGGRAPRRVRSAADRCGRCAGASRSRPCRRAGRGTVLAVRMTWFLQDDLGRRGFRPAGGSCP